MQPTPQDVHIDAALTDFSVAYFQDETNFVWRRAFPSKPVQHMTNKFFIFVKNDMLRDDAVKQRAPGEAAPRSGFSLSTDSYDAAAWWTEVPLSDMVVKNSDPSISLPEAATRLVTQRMLIRGERIWASKFYATGIWGTDKVGSTDFTKWSDYASDPQADIDSARETILQNTGREANKLIVSYKVHNRLKRHPIIKDMYKYTSSKSITADMLAAAFELDEYIVSKASYATNEEGAAGAYSFIAGDNALLVQADGSPAIIEPCAAATFAWTELTAVNSAGIAIDSYYDQKTKEDVVRGQFAFDMKVTGNDLGYFFSSCI
jgi:hypothetical protein